MKFLFFYSTNLNYKNEITKGMWKHRIYIYSISNIFHIPIPFLIQYKCILPTGPHFHQSFLSLPCNGFCVCLVFYNMNVFFHTHIILPINFIYPVIMYNSIYVCIYTQLYTYTYISFPSRTFINGNKWKPLYNVWIA